VFASHLPSEVLQRPKHGFGVPVGKWFRGQLREYLQHTMLSPLALSRGFFDPSVVRGLVKQHLSGEYDHGHILWTLLTFEIWHQIYVDGEMM
jgi:asparagine synthase (glutamine-hydrolysing)